MSDEIQQTNNQNANLQAFAKTLEKLKLPKTAETFLKELNQKDNLNLYQKSLSTNPLVEHLIKKLETKKITKRKPNRPKENEKQDDENSKIYDNSYFNTNKEIINSNIFKALLNNFNYHKVSLLNKTSPKIIFTGNIFNNNGNLINNTDANKGEDGTDGKGNNKNDNNNSLLNEDDSIFTNQNASNVEDSNATQFNPPKKLNPKKKNSNRYANPFSGTAQLDKILKLNTIKINQSGTSNIDNSSFFVNSRVIDQSNISNYNTNNTKMSGNNHQNNNNVDNEQSLDEYVDDDDPGFDLYECDREYQNDTSKKLAEQYGYPDRAVYKSQFKNLQSYNKSEKHKSRDDSVENSKSNLPPDAKYLKSADPYYPIINNNVILDSFNLKVIINREKIGFEPEKELKFKKNELIAGRYQFERDLGDAAFSTAIECFDILEKRLVCIKIIKNNKDYFDQSIDEIKLLRYINANGDPDKKCFLRVYDHFYFKEHLMIVSELLKDNLYDFYKYLIDHNNMTYFTVERIQKLTKQILICLDFIHDLKIIHCDLKPENILMKSISESTCKVIDFGSSCFVHDHLSSYIQSRSYRAPEVILGCRYDYKIDMWSLGCILAEIYTGNVLFQNDSVQSMLARIIGICGPIPNWMYEKGKLVNDFFTKEKLLYMEPNSGDGNESVNQSVQEKGKKIHILVPKKSSLRKRLRTNDEQFFNFVKSLLEIDPNLRLSAKEALNHPFVKDVKI